MQNAATSVLVTVVEVDAGKYVDPEIAAAVEKLFVAVVAFPAFSFVHWHKYLVLQLALQNKLQSSVICQACSAGWISDPHLICWAD